MAYAGQQVYMQATGQLGTGGGAGEEIFSYGLRVSGGPSFSATAALAALDTAAVATLFGDHFSAALTSLNDRAHLYSIKFSALDVNGELITDPVTEEPAPGGVSGFASSPDYPNQIALCVSLRTVTNVGHATKGRFYLPVPAMGMTPQGRISSGNTANVVGTTVTLIEGINSEFGTGATTGGLVSIMSKIGSGTSRAVSRVLVGDVFDTIRNRRNAISETYASGDVTLP